PARLSVPFRGGGGQGVLEVRVCRPETQPEVCVAAQRHEAAPELATFENLPAGKFILVIEPAGKKPLRLPIVLRSSEQLDAPLIDLSGLVPQLSSQAEP